MKCTLLLLGILGGMVPLAAQTSPQTPAQGTPAQSTPATFGDAIVVTASLEPAGEADVAATVTVIDAKQVEERQARSVLEVLATVPGFSVVQTGSPGKVTSVFSRGTGSNQTLALWNGIPLNDPFFGAFDWAFLSTTGVERIEVVRGPLSTLYGSNAVGGTVQVLTGHYQGLNADLEGGSNGYGRAAVVVGHDYGDFHLDLIGHARTGDGELDNDFYDGEEVVARGEWTLQPDLKVGFLARLNDSEIGIPRSGSVLTPNRTQSWQSRELAVPLTARFGDWDLDVLLSQVDTDFKFRDPDDSFDRNDTDAQSLRGRAVATYHLQPRAWVAFGSEWRREEASNANTFGINLASDSQRNWAAFGQFHYGWHKVILEAGLRRDDNDYFGSETSPNLALVLRLGGDTRLRASYGEAFRAPSLGELFFPFSGNPDLLPETSESYELALEHGTAPWSFRLALFELQQDNLIDFDPVTFTNRNLGRARSRGVEAELGYLHGPFALHLNGTYLDAEDRNTGLDLLRRPQRSANLLLSYRPGDLTFSLEGRYVGSRPDLDAATFLRATNPSYTRLDLAARWQLSPRLAPFARVENLADRSYQEALGFPAPGRAWVGGLSFKL